MANNRMSPAPIFYGAIRIDARREPFDCLIKYRFYREHKTVRLATAAAAL